MNNTQFSKILIFDIEYFTDRYSKKECIIQFGYQIIDLINNKILQQRVYYINDNYNLDNYIYCINECGKFTRDDIKNAAINLTQFLNHFYGLIKKCDLVISHNYKSDRARILKSCCYKNISSEIMEYIDKKEFFCTCQNHELKQFFFNNHNNQNKNGGLKQIKLEKLCQVLNVNYADGHNALADTKMLTKCVKKLYEQGFINLDVMITN